MLRWLLVLICILTATAANAQSVSIGDSVVLTGDNPQGVPVHRKSSASRLGYAEAGTIAIVKDTDKNGRWLRVSMGEATVWVLARYARPHPGGAAQSPSPAAIDRSALLDAACEGTGARELLVDDLFRVCFDTEWRIPVWVAYQLRPNAMSGPGDRAKSPWKQDERIKSVLQAFDRDYVGEGWHRGHMAPAEAFTRTQQAVDFTHQFSNAVPQSGSVNSGAWSKLEKRVRALVEDGASVWVFTGGLSLALQDDCLEPPYDSSCRCLSAAGGAVEPARQMADRVAIPSHTFKTFLVEHEKRWTGFAFVMTNIHRPMGSFLDYQYSIDRVEALLGIDLYASLDAATEQAVETNTVSISPKRSKSRCP